MQGMLPVNAGALVHPDLPGCERLALAPSPHFRNTP
jgi:hypothetical protein